ncbi:hypothetical protein AALA90_16325 [Lachnospiraceae bacterium 38-10]
MSKFSQFMKSNKTEKKNEMYAATKSLCDEKGKPLEWEFRHITSKENEVLRERCSSEVPVTGKPNVFRSKFNSGEYVKRIIVESVVYPDLMDAELQDSYGVKKPEDLLMEMVDDPGEYNDLAAFIQKFHGFDVTFEDKVKEAKNS